MLKNIKNAPEIFRDDCSRYHPGYRPITSIRIKQREGESGRSPRSRPLTGTNRLRQHAAKHSGISFRSVGLPGSSTHVRHAQGACSLRRRPFRTYFIPSSFCRLWSMLSQVYRAPEFLSIRKQPTKPDAKTKKPENLGINSSEFPWFPARFRCSF